MSGAIVGVGVDVAEIGRFERLIARGARRAWEHWYTAAESEECLRHARPGLAAAIRFAVKEAAYKALGAQFSGAVRWRDIEVLGREPVWRLTLHGEVAAAAGDIVRFHVSTCQLPGQVMAVVIAEGQDATIDAPAEVTCIGEVESDRGFQRQAGPTVASSPIESGEKNVNLRVTDVG